MKISRIDVFQLDIPLEKPKRYPNRTYDSLDDTIVRLETDSGLVGWGEVCPIASTYQPEHALGVRAAIEEMAPGLIGEDPTQTDRINATMNRWLMGGRIREVGHRHCLLGHCRQGLRPASLPSDRRAHAGEGPRLSRDRDGAARDRETAHGAVPRRGLHPLPGQGGAGQQLRTGHRAHTHGGCRASSRAKPWWWTPTRPGRPTRRCASSG